MVEPLVLLVSTINAQAQEAGQLGLTVGGSQSLLGITPSVGMIWHVTDRFAIRPDLLLVAQSFEGGSRYTSTGINVYGLVYVRSKGEIRVYVAPNVSYSRYTSRYSFVFNPGAFGPPSPFGTPTTSTTSDGTVVVQNYTRTHAYGSALSVGAQYRFAHGFALFGEAGGGYSRTNGGGAFVGASGGSGSHTWATHGPLRRGWDWCFTFS